SPACPLPVNRHASSPPRPTSIRTPGLVCERRPASVRRPLPPIDRPCVGRRFLRRSHVSWPSVATFPSDECVERLTWHEPAAPNLDRSKSSGAYEVVDRRPADIEHARRIVDSEAARRFVDEGGQGFSFQVRWISARL